MGVVAPWKSTQDGDCLTGDDSGSFHQLLQICTNGNEINTFPPEYIKLSIIGLQTHF